MRIARRFWIAAAAVALATRATKAANGPLGLPIGSGQVEAQCKTLVGARCKQAGMRNWTYAGAEGVLRMRAAKHDGSFDAFWEGKLRRAA